MEHLPSPGMWRQSFCRAPGGVRGSSYFGLLPPPLGAQGPAQLATLPLNHLITAHVQNLTGSTACPRRGGPGPLRLRTQRLDSEGRTRGSGKTQCGRTKTASHRH